MEGKIKDRHEDPHLPQTECKMHIYSYLTGASASPYNPQALRWLSTVANAHAQHYTMATPSDLYQSNFFKSNLYSNLVPSNHLNLESPSALPFPVEMNTADASTIVLSLPEKKLIRVHRGPDVTGQCPS